MDEEGGEFFGFAMVESGSGKRGAEDDNSKVREKGGFWRRGRREGRNGASAVGDADSVFCGEGKGALIVVVGVLVGERDVIGVCVRKSSEKRSIGGRSVPLGAGGKGAARACREKTGGVERSNAGSVAEGSGRQE